MTSGNGHENLLERATAALERIDATVDRQAAAFDRQAESHERMMRRMERSEKLIVRTLGDIDISIQRSTDRLDRLGETIDDIRADVQAHTKAVLAIIDRLGPATS